MAARTEIANFQGRAGRIECAIDWPQDPPAGWALILHPHPLHGGTRNNKVVTTMAQACIQRGLAAVRPDFRGVGRSEGEFDGGRGETEDIQDLVAQFRERHPQAAAGKWVLGGFSFGTAVAAQLHAGFAQAGEPLPDAMILVGTAVKRYQFRAVEIPADTLAVHGEQDEVVPLAEVLDWARPIDLPVVVVPGAGHFFHGKLLVLRQLVRARLSTLGGAPS